MLSSMDNHMLNNIQWLGCAAALGACLAATPAAMAELPFLSSEGWRFVDPTGNPVVLKGCNLGNWLMLESWMLGGCISDGAKPYRDQAQLFRTLQQRFGQEKFDELMTLYRDGYIQARDFELIKSFGFNVVRVPFDYRLLQSDVAPYALKPDAFAWLDHAVKLAAAAQIYVILDMHGTPGGQSNQHHTGESEQNHLWNNDVNKHRTIALWGALAEHFKDDPTVAAYDLINEPYGDYHTDERPELAELLPKIYAAVRATGDRHIVFFPGALNGGIGFYGDPHAQGWTNVAFTEHYYPGLFGSKPALETQARMLNQELPEKLDSMRRLGVPYYVGEFNIVLSSEYPNRMMRAYYDRFGEYGWAATMWSYKLLTPHGGVDPDVWYLVTNADALPKLDINTSSLQDFESFFQSMATMSLAVNQPLREALTNIAPPPLYLAEFPKALTAAPAGTAQADPAGFSSLDIGPTTPGCTAAGSDGGVVIYAGGSDVHGNRDSCRFVSEPATGSADLAVQFTELLDTHLYAKAGIMARWGEGADAAMAMINIFPDGQVALISRKNPGAATVEIKPPINLTLSVELRLKIADGQASGFYRDNNGSWKTLGTAGVPTQSDFRIGVAACSHVDGGLTVVKARIGTAADLDLPASASIDPPGVGRSLLGDGVFEWSGGRKPLPVSWNLRDEQNGVALWRDVAVVPGKRYALRVLGSRNLSTGQHAGEVELRLENLVEGGPVTLNSQKYEIARLPDSNPGLPLTVFGTSTSDKLRILLVVTSPADRVTLRQISLNAQN
jgi:endoglucanase